MIPTSFDYVRAELPARRAQRPGGGRRHQGDRRRAQPDADHEVPPGPADAAGGHQRPGELKGIAREPARRPDRRCDHLSRGARVRPAPGAVPAHRRGHRDIGDLQVRNRGTIGGGLAHADPASDMPAVMLALDATFNVRSKRGRRSLKAREFFQGAFTTALAEDELLTGDHPAGHAHRRRLRLPEPRPSRVRIRHRGRGSGGGPET